MKLNEFKKAKLNELDLSSFLGDYGSAAVRSGLGSLMGKNTLSTQDQMAKDQFIKNFTSRAASGLQSAINSGLVNPASTATSGANIGTNMGRNPAVNPATQAAPTAGRNVSPTPAQKRGAANKAGVNAFDQMANQLTAQKSPEQIRKEKQAAATSVAQNQMAQNGPFSKLPANQPAVQAGNIRQQKQAQAATAAQDQMAPMSKLPADQFAKTAASTRQKQQAQAATTAQDQMAPMSKLPADQFDKTASSVRQKKQAAATQVAQQQMSTPAMKEPKPDNRVQMPKRNKKPIGKVAESHFDKLDSVFESILAEATMAQTVAPAGKVVGQANQQQSKQSISQYVTNFFKQFMKGVNISDPSVMTNVASLTKQLEQTYAKDKGKSVLPKLADLAWSVSHAQAEQPQAAQAKPTQRPTATATTPQKPQAAQASNQAKMTVTQIKKLMQGLTPNQKKSLLASLEAEVNKEPAATKTTAPSNTVKMPKIRGTKQGGPTPDEEAKLQQRIQQAAAQQK